MQQENTHGDLGGVESRILQEMERLVSCPVDELVQAVPDYTWNQVFSAVDRLSRHGALILRHPSQFTYVVEVGMRACRLTRP